MAASEARAREGAQDSAEMRRLAELAAGLRVLIRFHDREIDTALLAELDRHAVAAGLVGLMRTAEGVAAAEALAQALAGIGATPGEARLDGLAAEYADLYLTHGYRVSPSGSVWLTEDKLERQLPMFDVRDWYEHYGISVPNWRVRADDHIVHELEFVTFLCQRGAEVPASDAARFLDLHVLPWVPAFCDRAGERVADPLYQAVMALTKACLDELRDTLEDITGLPRDIRPLPGPVQPAAREDTSYLPGVEPSW